MITLTDFSEYVPEVKKFGNAVYLISAEGVDWYESLADFWQDSYKVIYNSEGLILGFSQDANYLWPAGLSISEVYVNDVPPEMLVNKRDKPRFYYSQGKIITK